MFSSDNALISNALPISFTIPKKWEAAIEPVELLYKRIANSVNGKESSLYPLNEVSTFVQYFRSDQPNAFRNVYRKCFDIVELNGGNVAAAAALTFPHNIASFKESALIYVNATNTAGRSFSYMYPYVSMDSTNVYVTNPDAANALTQCDVIANYLKD